MTADRMGRAEEARRRRICQEKIEEGARKGNLSGVFRRDRQQSSSGAGPEGLQGSRDFA